MASDDQNLSLVPINSITQRKSRVSIYDFNHNANSLQYSKTGYYNIIYIYITFHFCLSAIYICLFMSIYIYIYIYIDGRDEILEINGRQSLLSRRANEEQKL